MTRPALAIAFAAGLPLAAAAQQPSFTSDSTITMHLTWREATTSGGTIPNPNGILEPGEHALISIDSVSFANQGAVAHFVPPIGTFASGTVTGFGVAFLEIDGSGGTAGSFNVSTPLANSTGTSGFGVRADWRLRPTHVNAQSDGIGYVDFGQSPADPSLALTANPISNVFRMLWTPADFNTRTARFTPAAGPGTETAVGAVYLDLDHALGARVYVPINHITFGSVSIPIIPAPPSLLILLAAARRRRRSRRKPI